MAMPARFGRRDREGTSGNANINTTMRYSHSSDDAERQAVSRLEKSIEKTVTVKRRGGKGKQYHIVA
jgi:hypothetical protein